jgi:hypothetical protein
MLSGRRTGDRGRVRINLVSCGASPALTGPAAAAVDRLLTALGHYFRTDPSILRRRRSGLGIPRRDHGGRGRLERREALLGLTDLRRSLFRTPRPTANPPCASRNLAA